MSNRKHVLLQPIDQPDGTGLVRLNTSLLHGIDSLTSLRLKHDPPDFFLDDGTPVYCSWMRSDLLIAYVQTITSQRPCFTEHVVSFSELQEALNHEGGFHLFQNKKDDLSDNSIVKGSVPRTLVGCKRTRSEIEREVKTTLCAASCAISSWVRLQHAFMFNANKTCGMCNSPGFSSSSSRVTLKIIDPPLKIVEHTLDPIHDNAVKRPHWLNCFVAAFAVLRSELVEAQVHTSTDYSGFAFKKMQRKVDGDCTGDFLCILGDMPACCKRGNCCNQSPRGIHLSEFEASVFKAVVDAGVRRSNTDSLSEKTMYCRALIGLALKRIQSIPRLASLLSISREDHVSHEQTKLQSYFLKHNIRIVAWSQSQLENETPLVFPPSLRRFVSHSPNVYVTIEVG